MFDVEVWQEIFSSIRNNKLRTILTGISVALGIFILVILLGLGNGLKNGVMSNFENQSLNGIYMWTGVTDMPYKGLPKGRRISFDIKDYEALKSMKEVQLISAIYRGGNMVMIYNGEQGSYSATGCHPDLCKIEGYDIIAGRFVNVNDISNKRKVVVIGENVKDELFKHEDPIGKYVTLNGVAFQIVGMYVDPGSTRNKDLYMPYTTLQVLFSGGSDKINNIKLATVPVQSSMENQIIETKIRATVAQYHRFDPKDEKAMGFRSTYEDYSNVNMMFMGISIFIWIIGFGTLIAGIVGVSNVMLIMIKERTKEIGIRRAIGATPRAIIRLVLTEAVFITAMFGYVGMILGVAVLGIVNFMIVHGGTNDIIIKDPSIHINVAIEATLLLVAAGALAGYFPAKKAVKQKPIDAIRSE